MSYLERAQLCNQYDLTDYRPFKVSGSAYGWIRHSFASLLEEWPEVFDVQADAVSIVASLDDYQSRSEAVNRVVTELHKRGTIDTWVGEPYPVTRAFEEEPLFEMERSAVTYFGLLGFGIHMNGLVKTDEGVHVWVGKRAHDKPFYPGKLDQMVAGGQPLGISVLDNLLKECAEEANIPAEIAKVAEPRGQIHYMMETSRGVDVSTIMLYDLWLEDDFEPENTDGEVDSFVLIPLGEVARLTDETDLFKDNCNLVNIDLLIRSGIITSEHQDFEKLTAILYQKNT